MRFASLLPIVFASTALASYHPKHPKHKDPHAGNDEYIKKLDKANSDVLLHQTTGVESGLDPGVVSAVIPDPKFPEYSLYWLRDACLVYDMWLNRLIEKKDTSLRPLADDIMHALIRTQHVVSLSGDMFTGGLEEPVFYYNISMILNLSYRPGSPAADGPPFRGGIMMKYAHWLLEPEAKNSSAWVAQNLWPAINLDLKWISTHWNSSSYDLWWPPIWGGSYWTAALQYRTLRGGAALGRRLNILQDVVDYEQKANLVLDYMQTFWNPTDGFMSETTDVDLTQGRTGPGSAPHTATIYNFDITRGCDDLTLQPCSPRSLSNMRVLGDRFKKYWPTLCDKVPKSKPCYYGFFTEDEFIGGHPQFFATYNVAEVIYDAIHTWDVLGHVEVTDVSLKFWAPLIRDVKVGKHKKGHKGYETLIKAARYWAEDIMSLLASKTPKDYVLTEVVNKTTNEPGGPRGMIRSLTAALSAADTRGGMVPRPWDGRKPNTKPHHASEGAEFAPWDAGENWVILNKPGSDSYESDDSYDSYTDEMTGSAFSAQEQEYLEALYAGKECDMKPKANERIELKVDRTGFRTSMQGHRFQRVAEEMGWM
ncbi:unnamed protein product [Peniophora sp. CBMAI 1063]|nr:unnamed protein product [Peniophora sp. CBMAI 1063]